MNFQNFKILRPSAAKRPKAAGRGAARQAHPLFRKKELKSPGKSRSERKNEKIYSAKSGDKNFAKLFFIGNYN